MDIRDKAKVIASMYDCIAKGGNLQVRANNEAPWLDCYKASPSLDDDMDLWRIKPEPREWFVVVKDSGNISSVSHEYDDTLKYITVREVID